METDQSQGPQIRTVAIRIVAKVEANAHHLSFILKKLELKLKKDVISFEIDRTPLELTINQFEKDVAPFGNVILQNEKRTYNSVWCADTIALRHEHRYAP